MQLLGEFGLGTADLTMACSGEVRDTTVTFPLSPERKALLEREINDARGATKIQIQCAIGRADRSELDCKVVPLYQK